jgi:hypothetical protein
MSRQSGSHPYFLSEKVRARLVARISAIPISVSHEFPLPLEENVILF